MLLLTVGLPKRPPALKVEGPVVGVGCLGLEKEKLALRSVWLGFMLNKEDVEDVDLGP